MRPAHVARAALEGVAWRVADIVSVIQETVPVQVLRVDGGMTRDPTLLQLQADAAGVTVQRGLLDATAAGAAALAAVGAGVWRSTLEIEERIPSGERFEPRRDAQWRAAAHAEWRALRRARRRAMSSWPYRRSPAKMCSVPSMCSRMSRTARPLSRLRNRRTRRRCCAFECVSSSGGCGSRVISSLIRP